MRDIPLIDLTPALCGGLQDEVKVARALDRACREIGFFALCGHGIDRSTFEDVHDGLAAFFALPLMDKLRYRLVTGPTLPGDEYTPYGYSAVLEENAYAHMGIVGKPNDYVEKFSAGRLILDDQTALPFPDNTPGRDLRRKLKTYYQACQALCQRLTELFTLSLDLPRDYFTHRIDRSSDSMRGHFYPGFTGELDNDQGMGEHCDSTLLTLLTHTAPGIQVKTRDGRWITPQFREIDHFIVNIGDLMAHWTKNAYVSTPHRVILGMEARQSLAFFKLTNEDEMVQFGNKQMDALLGRNRTAAP
jgi:isopenicillin N synthase-like dioxygenase